MRALHRTLHRRGRHQVEEKRDRRWEIGDRWEVDGRSIYPLVAYVGCAHRQKHNLEAHNHIRKRRSLRKRGA